jgi:hypothetical protein
MKKRHIVGAAAALAAAPIAMIGAAGATPTKNQAAVVSNVRITSATTAEVTARYICQPDEIDHLWVSVKQAPSARPSAALQEEGSGFGGQQSGVTAAWSQSHPTTLQCDGAWHTQTFTVDQTEPLDPDGPGPLPPVPGAFVGYGTLREGQAWVQFCLTGEGPTGGFEMSQRWAAIR